MQRIVVLDREVDLLKIVTPKEVLAVDLPVHPGVVLVSLKVDDPEGTKMDMPPNIAEVPIDISVDPTIMVADN